MWIIEKTRGIVNHGTSLVSIIGGVGILAVSLVVLFDIVLRTTLNLPITGLGDVVKYSFAVIIASFYPVGLAKGHNVTIQFLGKALGPRFELALESFGALITLFVVTMLAWKVYGFAIITTQDGLTTLTIELPQAPFWWAVAAIFAICVPVQLFLLIDKFLQTLSGRPAANDQPQRNSG